MGNCAVAAQTHVNTAVYTGKNTIRGVHLVLRLYTPLHPLTTGPDGTSWELSTLDRNSTFAFMIQFPRAKSPISGKSAGACLGGYEAI